MWTQIPGWKIWLNPFQRCKVQFPQTVGEKHISFKSVPKNQQSRTKCTASGGAAPQVSLEQLIQAVQYFQMCLQLFLAFELLLMLCLVFFPYTFAEGKRKRSISKCFHIQTRLRRAFKSVQE